MYFEYSAAFEAWTSVKDRANMRLLNTWIYLLLCCIHEACAYVYEPDCSWKFSNMAMQLKFGDAIEIHDEIINFDFYIDHWLLCFSMYVIAISNCHLVCNCTVAVLVIPAMMSRDQHMMSHDQHMMSRDQLMMSRDQHTMSRHMTNTSHDVSWPTRHMTNTCHMMSHDQHVTSHD